MLNSCLSFYLKASLKSRTAANRLAPCRAAGTTPQPSTAQGWFEQLLIGQPLAALIALPALGHGLERMKRLARENAMLRNMIDMAADLVVMVHDGEDDGRVVYANDAACRHFGVDRETLLTWRPEDWDVGLDAAGMAQVRARSNMQGKYAFETRHRVAGNAVIPVEVITHPFQHEGECFSVSIVRDLRPHLAEQARRLQAERHSAESEGLRRLDEALRQREDEYRRHIHRLAFFDSLTELPNRSRLSEQLCQAIEQAARHDQQFGLMLLDLDHFKMINDTLGHAVGDQLLCLVAERLQACVRNCDTVARLGGDEFAVLLPDVRGNGDLSRVAGRIIEAFGVSFSLSGKEFFVSSSIGIALYPADSADMDALFKYADLAMYAAKQRGRNNYQFYCSELTERSTERMTLEMALRKAMANDELELYYQPLADVCSGRIVGAEALLRWNRGELGLVAPDSFIAVAEATGLIVPM
ncbi:MAG: diguanylate cyclase, partial [Methylococcaceae bacterium]